MKRYVALLLALVALALAVGADATSGRLSVANRTATTRFTSIANLPGLQWWIEPDGISATGSAIDSWADKSGNGHTISSSGASRPTLVTSVLNGFSGAQTVQASSQYLQATNTVLFSGRTVTFGLVMRPDALPGTNGDYFFSNATTGNGIGLTRNTVADPNTKWNVVYEGVANQNGSTAIVTGSFYTIIYRTDGTGNGTFRLNRGAEVLASNSTGLVTPGGTASLTIGGKTNLTAFVSATFVAGFLCNVYLPDQDVRAAENYWKAKYPSLP